MRKIFPIALLFFIGFSQTGYHVFTVCYQLYLKEEMKEAILHMADRSELTCISYTDHKAVIEWEEEGKEFSFQHEMYDVAYTDTIKGEVLLYCANDSRETALVEHYKTANKNSNPLNKKSTSQIFKVTDLFCVSHTAQAQNFSAAPAHFMSYCGIPVAGISRISSPPPKATLS